MEGKGIRNIQGRINKSELENKNLNKSINKSKINFDQNISRSKSGNRAKGSVSPLRENSNKLNQNFNAKNYANAIGNKIQEINKNIQIDKKRLISNNYENIRDLSPQPMNNSNYNNSNKSSSFMNNHNINNKKVRNKSEIDVNFMKKNIDSSYSTSNLNDNNDIIAMQQRNKTPNSNAMLVKNKISYSNYKQDNMISNQNIPHPNNYFFTFKNQVPNNIGDSNNVQKYYSNTENTPNINNQKIMDFNLLDNDNNNTNKNKSILNNNIYPNNNPNQINTNKILNNNSQNSFSYNKVNNNTNAFKNNINNNNIYIKTRQISSNFNDSKINYPKVPIEFLNSNHMTKKEESLNFSKTTKKHSKSPDYRNNRMFSDISNLSNTESQNNQTYVNNNTNSNLMRNNSNHIGTNSFANKLNNRNNIYQDANAMMNNVNYQKSRQLSRDQLNLSRSKSNKRSFNSHINHNQNFMQNEKSTEDLLNNSHLKLSRTSTTKNNMGKKIATSKSPTRKNNNIDYNEKYLNMNSSNNTQMNKSLLKTSEKSSNMSTTNDRNSDKINKSNWENCNFNLSNNSSYKSKKNIVNSFDLQSNNLKFLNQGNNNKIYQPESFSNHINNQNNQNNMPAAYSPSRMFSRSNIDNRNIMNAELNNQPLEMPYDFQPTKSSFDTRNNKSSKQNPINKSNVANQYEEKAQNIINNNSLKKFGNHKNNYNSNNNDNSEPNINNNYDTNIPNIINADESPINFNGNNQYLIGSQTKKNLCSQINNPVLKTSNQNSMNVKELCKDYSKIEVNFHVKDLPTNPNKSNFKKDYAHTNEFNTNLSATSKLKNNSDLNSSNKDQDLHINNMNLNNLAFKLMKNKSVGNNSLATNKVYNNDKINSNDEGTNPINNTAPNNIGYNNIQILNNLNTKKLNTTASYNTNNSNSLTQNQTTNYQTHSCLSKKDLNILSNNLSDLNVRSLVDTNENIVTTTNPSNLNQNIKHTNSCSSGYNYEENKLLTVNNIKSIEELHLKIVGMLQSYNNAICIQEVAKDEENNLQTVNKCDEREIN